MDRSASLPCCLVLNLGRGQCQGATTQAVKQQKTRRRKTVKIKRLDAPKQARRRHLAPDDLQDQLNRRTRELSEALEQQAATADILRVISSSPTDLQPVLDAVGEHAARLCEANNAVIFRLEDDRLRRVAAYGHIPTTSHPLEGLPVNRDTVTGRAVFERRPIHVHDLTAETTEYPEGSKHAKLDGHRTTLATPMLREGAPIGAILIRRIEVRPFSPKQIELLTTFADQAVIAIENVRLFNVEQQRTRELSEALEQQTATSEVLQVISSSPGKLVPVFQAMLANATRICEASFGVLFRFDGNAVEAAAMLGVPPAFSEFWQRGPHQPGRQTALGRVRETKQIVHIVDVTAEPAYTAREPVFVAAVQLGRFRTLLIVPMLNKNGLIGAFAIYRQEVRPFTDKQIELVSSFAAQAVIAIENARLLNELRESLEQQTATSEVLEVIASSTGELAPVFSTMLANASHLCEASYGALWLCEGDAFRTAALHGDLPQVYIDQLRSGTLFHPRPDVVLARVAASGQPVQVADLRTDSSYLKGDPLPVAGVEAAGIRTLLGVPMFRDKELVGEIAIYRKEVKPFTDKQIALVSNFASQAVIAIENTRLLNELRERTRQLEVQSQEVLKLNQQLEQRVADQVSEIERMGRLRRFLPPQVADLIVASGTEKQLESHRREITALFCDLRGFTGFSESSDPEDVMALLREYHAAIGEIIIKYSGTLERYAGDGVMVIFNDPVPVPSPALQAVKMALDMRVAIGALTEKWRRLGHDLGFGIGIAHGFATLGTIGFEGRFDYAAIGTVSNVASRLCDEAKPGQILISPRVLMAVEEDVSVEPVGEFALKGIRRPMAAYNVLATKSEN